MYVCVYVYCAQVVFDSEEITLNLTSKIVQSNNVNPSVPGVYSVLYGVEDSAGNFATATRTVSWLCILLSLLFVGAWRVLAAEPSRFPRQLLLQDTLFLLLTEIVHYDSNVCCR